jgi:hypothetical protein
MDRIYKKKVQAICVLLLDPTLFSAQLYTSLAIESKTSYNSCELLFQFYSKSLHGHKRFQFDLGRLCKLLHFNLL